MRLSFGAFLKRELVHGASDAMARAKRPIVRCYLALAAVYYGCMVPVHFMALTGANQFKMVLVSLAAATIASFGWFLARKRVSALRLEAIAGIANLSVLYNVLAALHTSYDPSNLIYFPMMALAFAFTSASIRMAVVSISVVLISLQIELLTDFAGEGQVYGYIGFATALSGLGLVIFLQRAIQAAIDAKDSAEDKLSHAEAKLAKVEELNIAINHRAMTDSLTNLPNRRAFFADLDAEDDEKWHRGDRWLIALDLDGFKMVNDVYGHLVGDALLIAVSERMETFCGSSAAVYRIGGDEFDLIATSMKSEAECEDWCNRLLRLVAEPYDVEGRLIQLSASIGCTRIEEEQDKNCFIRNADYALLHAKKSGKNRTVAFTSEHAKNARERFEIEDALRVADFENEIEVLFQPQIDIARDQVVRAEALVRWDCPTLGRVEPDRFITIAEESGLISQITLAVLAKAIETLKCWEHPVPLAINLSGHDLLSNQIMDEILGMLDASELEPSLLEFEVTETAMMADTEKACVNLNRLSKLGYTVALDDFGTGYSNFNYLRELPIDKLKVDRSFVKDIGNPMTEKILHSLAVTASALGVQCLLEGVEDEIQLVMAKRVGADIVQGYIFGQPMEGKALVDVVADADYPRSQSAS